MTAGSNPEIRSAISRALAGEHVSELPPAVRAITERIRERLKGECIDRALEGFRDGGAEGLTVAFRKAVDTIFEQATAAVAAIENADQYDFEILPSRGQHAED